MSTNKDLFGTAHLRANPSIYEPARSNTFLFIVTSDKINKLLKQGEISGLNEENQYARNGKEILTYAVESSSVPHFTQQAIEIKRGNSTVKFAGVPTFDSGTIKIKDYIGDLNYSSKDVIMGWQALSYNIENDTVGRAKDYKMDCELVEYTVDNEFVRSWTLQGCWVSKIDEEAFDYTSTNPRTMTVTIVYDRAIPTLSEPEYTAIN